MMIAEKAKRLSQKSRSAGWHVVSSFGLSIGQTKTKLSNHHFHGVFQEN